MDRDDLQNWMILFKFGRREHLEQFRSCGLLCMRHQQYFREIESDETRSDRFETTDRIVQPNALGQLTVESASKRFVIKPDDLVGPVLISLAKSPCNIYCMFAVTQPVTGLLVDKRNFGFGDSFLIVLNTQTFLGRVFSAAKSRGFSCQASLVEYYDDQNYSGETGPFRKPAAFSYQNEFRFVVRPGSKEAIQLEVGSLADITSRVHPLSEVNRLVEFVMEPPAD
jgi:hypothetical protein